MSLVIIRGVPGSGKTTFAKKCFHDYQYFDADSFFTDESGNYNFIPSLASKAHHTCFQNVKLALQKKQNVVVANTFILAPDVDYYISQLHTIATSIRIFCMKTSFKSIHDVPLHIMERFYRTFEIYPNEIIIDSSNIYTYYSTNKLKKISTNRHMSVNMLHHSHSNYINNIKNITSSQRTMYAQKNGHSVDRHIKYNDFKNRQVDDKDTDLKRYIFNRVCSKITS